MAKRVCIHEEENRRWHEEEEKEKQRGYQRHRDVLRQEQDGTLGDDGLTSKDGRQGYVIGRDYDVANTPKRLNNPYYDAGVSYPKTIIWGIVIIIVLAIIGSVVWNALSLQILGYCYNC